MILLHINRLTVNVYIRDVQFANCNLDVVIFFDVVIVFSNLDNKRLRDKAYPVTLRCIWVTDGANFL